MKGILVSVASALIALSCHDAMAQPKPADASQFVGKWQVGFQEGEGVIVNELSISCDNPAIITQTSDHMIRVMTPGGGDSNWAVKEFGDALPWWKDDDVQVTMVAKWVEWEAFILAGKDSSGVKTDWDNAKQWTRCEE